MPVAQQLNQNNQPVYGCYLIGRSWYFMALQNQEYALSNIYACTNDEIFDIFKVIKGLRYLIEQQIAKSLKC